MCMRICWVWSNRKVYVWLVLYERIRLFEKSVKLCKWYLVNLMEMRFLLRLKKFSVRDVWNGSVSMGVSMTKKSGRRCQIDNPLKTVVTLHWLLEDLKTPSEWKWMIELYLSFKGLWYHKCEKRVWHTTAWSFTNQFRRSWIHNWGLYPNYEISLYENDIGYMVPEDPQSWEKVILIFIIYLTISVSFLKPVDGIQQRRWQCCIGSSNSIDSGTDNSDENTDDNGQRSVGYSSAGSRGGIGCSVTTNTSRISLIFKGGLVAEFDTTVWHFCTRFGS